MSNFRNALFGGACAAAAMVPAMRAAAQQPATSPADAPPTVTIYKHSAWSTVPPKGVQADGIRRNLAVDDSATFKDLTLALAASAAAGSENPGGDPPVPPADQVTLKLQKGDATETITVTEGTAFNWQGYHIAVLAWYATKGELGFNTAAVEIATVASLPPAVAESTTSGGPEFRLRVPHAIDKLTLHHSATPLALEDNLGQKLENMQKWGERDRQWWDIPYHFIVDIDGSVYEARDWRYVGDTNTRYDPAGHFLVNCYGDYNKAEPNAQQLETVANLFAWAAMENGIDPIKIYGHCDLADTSCPGANLHKHITDGTLGAMVQEKMKKGKPTLVYVDEAPKE